MITEQMRAAAEERMRETMRRNHKAVRARYDRRRSAVVIRLENGMDLVLPKRLVHSLAQAGDAELAEIEISPTGLGLHWPQLDADLYVPALLDGALGPQSEAATSADARQSRR